MLLWVKICGVTSVEDALHAIDAGADAIGVNFVESSPRRVEVATARAVREAVGDRAEVVAVVADRSLDDLRELRERSGIRSLQLHGAEPPDLVAALLPEAYKAVRIGAAADVADAARFPGERLLTDTKLPGVLGGSGQSFDWSLVTDLARARRIVLAGGLRPDNVAEAVRRVQPFGVDTASGVEGADPRRKDHDAVTRFVRVARAAAAALDRGDSVDYERKP